MLSIVVFLLILSDNLPKSDQKPLLSQMIIGLTLFSLLGVFFTILISALSDYNENYSKENKKMSNTFIEYLYNKLQYFKRCSNNKVHPEKEDELKIESTKKEAFIESDKFETLNINTVISDIDNPHIEENLTMNIINSENRLKLRTKSYNNSVPGIKKQEIVTLKKKKHVNKEECQEMINYFENIYIIVFTISFIIYCAIMFNRIPEH